jgi:hypothetical protein
VYHGKDLWGRHVPAEAVEAVLHAVLLGNADPCALPIIYDIRYMNFVPGCTTEIPFLKRG